MEAGSIKDRSGPSSDEQGGAGKSGEVQGRSRIDPGRVAMSRKERGSSGDRAMTKNESSLRLRKLHRWQSQVRNKQLGSAFASIAGRISVAMLIVIRTRVR